MIPKFRAWDKNTNDMVDVKTIDLEKDGSIGCIVDYNGINLDVSECILMQSTGLKDKNGVEIFEGDLVEHDDNINGTWETFEACEIVYDVEYAQFCFKNDASNFLSYYRNLCIIGNIHENPELLEKASEEDDSKV
ncbi:hypothetical protein IGK72_000458 [Enterococcus sp. DIV0183]|uniref:YopX family protein n=1 Tax=Enterococcus sp. DIV0183 TaxID=2774864 RepID=UPI003D30005B